MIAGTSCLQILEASSVQEVVARKAVALKTAWKDLWVLICSEFHDGSAREPQNLTLRKKCSIAPVVTRVQAANAAAAAEGNGMGSANHARIEQSMASLAAAMAAMALFEQVTHCCTVFFPGQGFRY